MQIWIKTKIMGTILIDERTATYVTDNVTLDLATDFTESELSTIKSFTDLIELKAKNKNAIPIPAGRDSVYTMQQHCPVRADLTVKVWDMNYSDDKELKVIKIDVLAIHFDANGERVPQFDAKSYVVADMSEERKIQIAPDVFVYSYAYASELLETNSKMSILVAQAIQIADLDGSLNKRLYNL